ncbi:homeobox protein abdominal-A homolog [Copidosoma floridanum]|uniref:homeobox protein abdominal-A homolog n=1 Tax=Copidosoma floridanum TaxID=29053 RepID=UPI0006C9BFB3|nr:homeobox protein abdominal-A homolog [Copidosoma floridanum]
MPSVNVKINACDSKTLQKRRNRTAITCQQKSILQREFAKSNYLSPTARHDLAKKLGLTEPEITTWYQNRRYLLKKASKKDSELDAHPVLLPQKQPAPSSLEKQQTSQQQQYNPIELQQENPDTANLATHGYHIAYNLPTDSSNTSNSWASNSSNEDRVNNQNGTCAPVLNQQILQETNDLLDDINEIIMRECNNLNLYW